MLLAGGNMRSLASILLLIPMPAIAAGQIDSDFNAGPVILFCSGEQTSATFSVGTKSKHQVYRLDARAKTFQVWNESSREFVSWGDGKLRVSPTAVDFAATDPDRGVRNVHFDRVTGAVADEIQTKTRYFTLTFMGRCRPGSEPQPPVRKL